MPTTTIQSQIQQLQAQLKLSQSPKQTKMLQSAIARLEEKLKEETAEQARLKAEAEAKAKAAQEAKEQEAKENAKKTTADSEAKKRQKKQQKHSEEDWVPGQGRHTFYWKTWAEIQIKAEGEYVLLPHGADAPIPIRLGRTTKTTLSEMSLPAMRFCSLHPKIEDGKITSAQLNGCEITEEHPELFHAQGYWIAEKETFHIRTRFRGKGRSRNIFHQIPVKEGITPPQTGFRALQLERDRLNVYVVGEVDGEQAG